MITTFKWLIILSLVIGTAMGCIWLFEHDGHISIEWLDYRIEISTSVAIILSVTALTGITFILQIFLWLIHSPTRYRKSMMERKQASGLTALTEGFAAIAAGDIKHAKKLTNKAESYLGPIALTRLLAAQTAQLSGNGEEAKSHYTAMLEHKDTEIIAIKGLLLQAKQEGDLEKAIFLAEKALRIRPDAEWAVSILLDLYKRTDRWSLAQSMLMKATKLKIISQESANRIQGLTELAQYQQSIAKHCHDEALKYAHQAYKRLTGDIPAAHAYCEALLHKGETRKALKILETTYKTSPHTSIAMLYTKAVQAQIDGLDKQMSRLEKFSDLSPNHSSAHIAIARIAIDGGAYSKARNHLKIALSLQETSEVCQLMAELEKQENADPDIISNWINRAHTAATDNSSWHCNTCHYSDMNWSYQCSHCRSFDSLIWKEHTHIETYIEPKTLNRAD